MSSLELLKGIGVQKLYETTHIARKYIEDILNENYSSMGSTQYYGFISIIQREFKLDLSDLKTRAGEYYNTQAPKTLKEIKNLRQHNTTPRRKNLKDLYLVLLILIFSIGAILYIKNLPQEHTQIDNTELLNAKSAVELATTIKNSDTTQETNSTEAENNNTIASTQEAAPITTEENNSQQKVLKQEPIDDKIAKEEPAQEEIKAKQEERKLKITPKERVWIGYIDMIEHKKYQKTINEPLELDGSKEWLVYLGHGYLSVDINGEQKEFKQKDSIRFLYKNGELKTLSVNGFTTLNGGKTW